MLRLARRPRASGEGERQEQGFALVVVIVVLAIVLLLVAAAATSALSSTDTSTRDVRAKQAQQAADAGLAVATEQMNMLSLDLRNVLDLTSGQSLLPTQCIVSAGVGGVLDIGSSNAGQPCDPVTEDLGTGASFSYQVSPLLNLEVAMGGQSGGTVPLSVTLRRVIVSAGTVDGVTRRVYEVVGADGSADRGMSSSKPCLKVLVLNVCGLGSLLKVLSLDDILRLLGINLDDLLQQALTNYSDLNLNTYVPVRGSYRACTPPADPSQPWPWKDAGNHAAGVDASQCPGIDTALSWGDH